MHVEHTKQTEKRDKLEIMIQLLQIAKEPIKKTRIMQVAYLNFYQVSRYLDYLMSAGLIENISKPYPGYRITEKGRMFLALLTVTDYKQVQGNGEARNQAPDGTQVFCQLDQIEQGLREIFKEDAVELLMEKIRSVIANGNPHRT